MLTDKEQARVQELEQQRTPELMRALHEQFVAVRAGVNGPPVKLPTGGAVQQLMRIETAITDIRMEGVRRAERTTIYRSGGLVGGINGYTADVG